MRLLRGRLFLPIFCAATLAVSSALSAPMNVTVPLDGSFTAGVSGGGTATLNGASGNFRQWIPGPFGTGGHVNIGVSAGAQNVGLTVNPVGVTNYVASGTSDLYVDTLTPTAPLNVDSLDVDLTSGANIPVGINVAPFSISTSLGNFNLQLTFTGEMTSLEFVSDGPSTDPGANYDVPGTFLATLQGNVTGQLVNVPLIGNINLGTLYTLDPTVVDVPGSLPGTVLTADASGGNGPYPADLLATYFAALDDIVAPIELPFEVIISQTVPNGQSGFSALNASGTINAELAFNTVSYNLSGVVQDVVTIPEPQSFALMFSAVIGALMLGMYRRKR